jgi:hypothetical protein
MLPVGRYSAESAALPAATRDAARALAAQQMLATHAAAIADAESRTAAAIAQLVATASSPPSELSNVVLANTADPALAFRLRPDDLAPLSGLCSLALAVMPPVAGDDLGLAAALARAPASLVSVSLIGPHALSLATLSALKACTHLRELNLSQCRCVLDDNNRIAGIASAQDVFDLFASHPSLQTLRLPHHCQVEVGRVQRVFPKQQVCVIQVTGAIARGDCLRLQKYHHTSFSLAGHQWTSNITVVDSILTDDHRELQRVRCLESCPASHLTVLVCVCAETARAVIGC